MTTAPIAVRDVRKTYRLGERRIEALRGVSLEIEAPGFDAIMGASGSGKSTLLHLIAGLDRPDGGEILVRGERIDALSERDLTLFRRHRLGIVFQQFNLIPTLTARENAMLPALLDGAPKREAGERADRLLERLGLAARRDHRPEALSGGEQQRVAIARALYYDPPVLLADEPTGNLDSEASEELWRLLRSIAAERDLSVLMVTHEPAAAVHCRRVFVLRDGLIEGTLDVAGLDPAGLATRYQRLSRPAG